MSSPRLSVGTFQVRVWFLCMWAQTRPRFIFSTPGVFVSIIKHSWLSGVLYGNQSYHQITYNDVISQGGYYMTYQDYLREVFPWKGIVSKISYTIKMGIHRCNIHQIIYNDIFSKMSTLHVVSKFHSFKGNFPRLG